MTVKLTIEFGVPVKVTVALPPGQTVESAEMDAVGGVMTVIVIVPV